MIKSAPVLWRAGSCGGQEKRRAAVRLDQVRPLQGGQGSVSGRGGGGGGGVGCCSSLQLPGDLEPR